MNKITRQAILCLFLCIYVGLISCERDTIYDPPKWLAGKVYTQIKSTDDLSTFARCIELTGYDTIIDISGSYTVFAPSDEAFELWFRNHPDYNSIEDIPIPVLTEIVSFHIVQNPWSRLQLTSLDVHGWIDSTDLANDKPRGFKRETLLRRTDKVFGVRGSFARHTIVDTLQTSWRRRVINSRKFAPLFFRQYFDIYDLSPTDYEFYFDRPFEASDDIYYGGAKIIGTEIFAENGFVYTIDRVVEPMKNAQEILNTPGTNNYSAFLNFLNRFPQFTWNEQATNRQPGAAEGRRVDSLFNLGYPQLAFDFTNERTQAPRGSQGLPSEVSIRFHHGLVAPTNEAFDRFVNDYFVGPNRWGSLENAPSFIRRIIANTHMSPNAIYPTDFVKGFYNGENDIINIDPGTIIHKEFGSNTTFIGVDRAVVPRAFSSVTGPVYLQRGYSTGMYAIEATGLLPTLKRRHQDYSFFIESDENLRADSSLMYIPPPQNRFIVWQIFAPGVPPQGWTVNVRELRILFMNHIGTATPRGLARKEFIPNLAGNYIIFNNQTGEVSGTAPTTAGYMGSQITPNFPRQVSTNADNGITYDIDNWFSFRSGNIYSLISNNYPHFHNLLNRAGLAQVANQRYTFISDNQFYTIFIPTAEALEEAGADELTGDALRRFLRLHFVQGDVIFTDGRKSPGYYETARIDERSTTFNTIYTKIYVKPGIDNIEITGRNGGIYSAVSESLTTNILASRTIVETAGPSVIPNIVNQGVIHEIDRAFLLELMDTK
jgi:uncharacterized surface protein with fasciclin (FAS1) repeats